MKTYSFTAQQVESAMEQFNVTGTDLIFHLLDNAGFEMEKIKNIEATRNGSGSYYVEMNEETVEVFI